MSVVGKKTQKAIEVYVSNRLSNEGDVSTDDIDNVVSEASEIFEVDQDDVRYFCNLPR